MEVRKPKIKSMKYEDFTDNEYLEKMIEELRANGTNVVIGCLDEVINWGRSNSLWPLTFATSCCGIEFMAVGAARYDFARFGFEVARASPRQADFIMVAGTITHKMAPVLRRLYDQMADPKYVIATGSCAVSGGPFKKSYHVVNGVDKILPVDVYIPGCPPRPEAMLYGMMQLQRKVKLQKFFGDVNRQIDKKEYEKRLREDLTASRTECGTRREEKRMNLQEIITAKVPGAVYTEAGDGMFTIPVEQFHDLARYLHDDPALRFDFLRSLTGMDWAKRDWVPSITSNRPRREKTSY